jgi:signal transduction histidine kinase
MLSLVSSLLVAKRAEELGMSLTLVACDCVELAARMVEMHRPMANGKGITIIFDSPAAMGVTTHPESFSQIASNLISNAVKYSPAGARVEVRLQGYPHEQRFTLEVLDAGPGIPPEERETIFYKFHRADNQPTGGETSHGIGLYIVEKLTATLNGKVNYSDRDEGGARFTVTLPSRIS